MAIVVWHRWNSWQASQKPAPKTAAISHTLAPVIPPDTATPPVNTTLPKPALNLELPPEEHFLMNSIGEVPEKESWPKDLFKPHEKEKSVKVGGSLILDEKPADPNAAVWDQVKGAEVGITIQTP